MMTSDVTLKIGKVKFLCMSKLLTERHIKLGPDNVAGVNLDLLICFRNQKVTVTDVSK